MSEPITQIKAAFNWRWLLTFFIGYLIIQALGEYFPSFNSATSTPIAWIKNKLGIK